MTTPPDRRAPRAAPALALALALAALGLGAWLWARAPGPGGDPAAPVAVRAAPPAGGAAAAPAVGAALGGGPAPGGAALTAVDGLPQTVEIVLPNDVCAEGAAVSLRVFVERRVGAAAAITGPRAPLALGPGCAAAVPLDPEALAAGRLRYLEVCAWGGARPRCAALHAHRWAPGDPPPQGAVAAGGGWRWAAALEVDEARATGCAVGAPGEIGGQELQLVQLGLVGRTVGVDLSAPGLQSSLGCALARLGHDLDTPAVGYGQTEIAGLLVQ